MRPLKKGSLDFVVGFILPSLFTIFLALAMFTIYCAYFFKSGNTLIIDREKIPIIEGLVRFSAVAVLPTIGAYDLSSNFSIKKGLFYLITIVAITILTVSKLPAWTFIFIFSMLLLPLNKKFLSLKTVAFAVTAVPFGGFLILGMKYARSFVITGDAGGGAIVTRILSEQNLIFKIFYLPFDMLASRIGGAVEIFPLISNNSKGSFSIFLDSIDILNLNLNLSILIWGLNKGGAFVVTGAIKILGHILLAGNLWWVAAIIFGLSIGVLEKILRNFRNSHLVFIAFSTILWDQVFLYTYKYFVVVLLTVILINTVERQRHVSKIT